MKELFIPFFKNLTIFAAFTAAIATLINLYVIPISFIFWIIPFFYCLSALLYWLFIKIATNNPKKIISAVMMVTSIKMFASIIVMIIYIFAVKYEIVKFILSFFSIYLLFTVFMVYAMQKKSKKII